MGTILRYVGMDVHAETIAVAVVESDGRERDMGAIANRPESIRKCLKKLGRPEELRCCYEAGPTGYVLYWQLVSRPRGSLKNSKVRHGFTPHPETHTSPSIRALRALLGANGIDFPSSPSSTDPE